MMRKIPFTKSGHAQIVQELEDLKVVKHPAAKDRLSRARAMGDLRENSEYHAAKEDLATIVGRIAELEEMIRWAEIVDDTIGKIEQDLVKMGCRVVIEKDGKRDEYHIVGEFEADPVQKKLSPHSPPRQGADRQEKGRSHRGPHPLRPSHLYHRRRQSRSMIAESPVHNLQFTNNSQSSI